MLHVLGNKVWVKLIEMELPSWLFPSVEGLEG
jgi:hypothetical protein